MSKPDLDALEKLLVTEAADPFAFVEAAPALLAMARRMEEAEDRAESLHVGGIVDRCDRDSALDACAARIAELLARAEQAERERDEARAALAEARASTRPLFDPPHVEVLRGMRREAALRLARAETDDSTPEWAIAECRAQAAALEAVLGEEVKS